MPPMLTRKVLAPVASTAATSATGSATESRSERLVWRKRIGSVSHHFAATGVDWVATIAGNAIVARIASGSRRAPMSADDSRSAALQAADDSGRHPGRAALI